MVLKFALLTPKDYQWFDLATDKEEIILEKSLEAEKKLNTFLDQIFNNFQLESNNLALVGFSQGCMMSIQSRFKKQKKGKLCNRLFWKNY